MTFTRTERLIRIGTVGFVVAILAALRSLDPVQIGHYTPWPSSCGAITGLPCLFCGMTRALHSFLQGDFSRACYLNWLVVPTLLALLALLAACLFELAKNGRAVPWPALLPRTARGLCHVGTAIVLLWTVQCYLAVSQHKTELLNPRGVLYPLFVKAS